MDDIPANVLHPDEHLWHISVGISLIHRVSIARLPFLAIMATPLEIKTWLENLPFSSLMLLATSRWISRVAMLDDTGAIPREQDCVSKSRGLPSGHLLHIDGPYIVDLP